MGPEKRSPKEPLNCAVDDLVGKLNTGFTSNPDPNNKEILGCSWVKPKLDEMQLKFEGNDVGLLELTGLKCFLVGCPVGSLDGCVLGCTLGWAEGWLLGRAEGCPVGCPVGWLLGLIDELIDKMKGHTDFEADSKKQIISGEQLLRQSFVEHIKFSSCEQSITELMFSQSLTGSLELCNQAFLNGHWDVQLKFIEEGRNWKLIGGDELSTTAVS